LLTVATENVSNPDVRDRAFIYWRMLSTDPEKTKTVVFGYRPQAKENDKLVDQAFLSEIMKSMGYVSSLFEKKPEELFQKSLAEQKVIHPRFRVSKSRRKKKPQYRRKLNLFLSLQFKLKLSLQRTNLHQ
jgi:vesicle coat complex subunit